MPVPVPVVLTATQDASYWLTLPYYPPSYSGTSYTHPFKIVPPAGQSFPLAAPNSNMVNSSDDAGGDNGTGTVTSSDTSQVTLSVTVSSGHTTNLGTGLNVTIILNYGSGAP